MRNRAVVDASGVRSIFSVLAVSGLLGSGVCLLPAGCAGPRATAGLLEGELPMDTLAPPGDLGIDELKFPSRRFVLPSGLRLTVERAPTRGMVGAVLTIGAGSTADPPGREGLAHLVEHLAFRARLGSAADGPKVNEALVALAASYNAATTLDVTRYYELAPKAALPQLLRLTAARLSRPLAGVTNDDFTLERTVVHNELRERNETGVYGQTLAWMQEALVPGDHPYARPLAGTHESLARATLRDALEFTKAHYAPENATLLLVGDFTADDVRRVIDEQLPPELRGASSAVHEPRAANVTRFPSKLVPAPAGGARIERAAVAAPEVWVGFLLPSAFSSQQGAVSRLVTAPVVARALRGRLPRRDVRDVDVVALHARFATLLACQVVLEDPARRAEVAREVTEAFAQMWRPLTPEEALKRVQDIAREKRVEVSGTFTQLASGWLVRDNRGAILGLRQQALAQMVFGAEAFAARAMVRAEYLHNLGSERAYEDMLVTAASVGTDEVAAFAQKYFAPERARVLFLDPVPPDQRPAPAAVGVAGTQKEIGDTPMAVARFAQPPWLPPPDELRSRRELRLANGLQVILLRRPQFGSVTVALGFRGGAAAGTPRGVVELLRAFEPAEAIADPLNAVTAEAVTLPDLTADVVRTGARNLSNALRLLALRLKGTDETDWDRALDWNEQVRRSAERTAPNPQEEAERRIARTLYGDHPYGQGPTSAELLAIKPEDMRAWMLRMRHPGNGILVIAGDFEETQAERLAQGWFGNWQARPEVLPPRLPSVPAPPTGAAHETVLITHRPGVSQTLLRIACRLPAQGPRDAAANHLLARLVGSYLFTRFRAETGAAYGVSASAASLSGGAAHMQLQTTVDDLRLADVLRSVRGHWRKFGEGAFDEGALSQVRWHDAIDGNLAFQTAAEVGIEVLATAGRGFGLERLTDQAKERATVTTADLARAFATCRAGTVLSLVGDESTIKAALARAEKAPIARERP